MVDTAEAAEVIREWLRKNVTGDRQIADDHPLIESGLLTSLQTVGLVVMLEERFGLVIEDEEFDEDNFASIAAISSLVASKTA
ncbi:MAG: acyl carrier protein [Chloroflexi bacterium]|nr:acyl carrier protein [Chloroflexota bacterium]